ncbi:DUF6265 family protein [Mucilaginibacter terrae]|uniref:DUF6265 domain-containing protein n=1 Tax=Mucilaginibacter terrae TaxID=1955052 RepID=A0ABU3GZC4_9SPHI|nr:DUF6265 family protein [Mucilaginibacter terrae]MDT3404332.1 hypothetical protein [Mucilaginibacter terrae]
MKATTRNLFLAAAIFAFVSQTVIAQMKPAKPTLANHAAWLLGTWQNKSPQGLLVEKWQKLNDSTYTGKSYFLAGKDTAFTESIVLEQRGGKLYYIPTVKNQNDGKPVKFTQAGKGLVFENPAHDFPQRITYTQIKPDSLVAEISGMSKGKFKSEKFPMGRVKK